MASISGERSTLHKLESLGSPGMTQKDSHVAVGKKVLYVHFCGMESGKYALKDQEHQVT